MFLQLFVFFVSIFITGLTGGLYLHDNESKILHRGNYNDDLDQVGVIPMILLWSQQLAFQWALRASVQQLVVTTVIGLVTSVITCLLVHKHSTRFLRNHTAAYVQSA